ncbi:DUF3892 domain-containing protein [uncultured Parasphingopyxis sp.]|uniref:DUF3892 domain-containing protein n=1 Tax=uncultured Parasphingopyxis sp. TaxID=1547918 RepID=UPI00345B7A05
MADLHVTCVRRDNYDSDRRIQGVGGSWGYHPIDAAISNIRFGYNTYYTRAPGVLSPRVEVMVREHPVSGRPFLTTDPDGHLNNNLLSLPECP